LVGTFTMERGLYRLKKAEFLGLQNLRQSWKQSIDMRRCNNMAPIKARFINNKVSCIVLDMKKNGTVYATVNGSKPRWQTLAQLNWLLARLQTKIGG
jgi:hypothetical protein